MTRNVYNLCLKGNRKKAMIESCPVCYEAITTNNTLPCRHNIHETCIISSGKAECPICRSVLPHYFDKVVEITHEPTNWGTLDKLVSLGWLKHRDIPIIDDLDLPDGNEVLLVKAVLLLYIIKQIIWITLCHTSTVRAHQKPMPRLPR